MKNILYTVLVGFIAAVAARDLRAQDATGNPFVSPTPRTESSSAPAASPIVQRATRAVATPTPTPSPKSSEVNHGVASTEKKSSGKKPSTSESINNQSTGKNGAGIVRRLENQWQKAIEDHDTSFVQKIIARDFVGVSSNGRVGDKSGMLYDAKRDKSSYKSVSSRNLSVHAFGPHVVVAIGVMTETGKTSSGHPFTYGYRFSDTWMDRDGKWQCVAAHSAAVPKK